MNNIMIPEEPDKSGSGRVPVATKWICLVAAISVTMLSIYQVFNIGLLVNGFVFLENQLLYIIIGMLLPGCFFIFPSRRFGRFGKSIDIFLALVTLCVAGYFTSMSEEIITKGWEYMAPPHAIIASFILWGIVLEATRRAGGLALFIVVFVMGLYPLFADLLPSVLSAHSISLKDIAIFHAMSSESVLGIPMRAFVSLVIGFMIFGVALKHTGGGRFFLGLSFALFGHVRGGPAKVAIFSSGFMGSMSGSVITNVLTTGVLTIPAMRRVGFSRSYAAGVEACASTGGVVMPPVMGATAFVMATYLGVDYATIAAAAVIPSVLYFFGLFCQIDARAARIESHGLPRSELPSVRETLRTGWYYIAVLVFLVWMLLVLNREAWAPYFATILLIGLNQFSKETRWGLSDISDFWVGVGRLFVELVAILAGIGFIVGSLVVSGKVGNLANDLLQLTNGNVFALLGMGALTAFVLGVGMTVTAAYIFLAIALAPALTSGGLNPMAVHLFILYWGMLSYITPPVALGAFAAASIAGASPMKTGFDAMRLGSIIYIIPFLFVLEPALILQGDLTDTLTAFIRAIFGILLISAAIENYLIRFGTFGKGVKSMIFRILLAVGGILIAMPGVPPIPFDQWHLLIVGSAFVLAALSGQYISKKRYEINALSMGEK